MKLTVLFLALLLAVAPVLAEDVPLGATVNIQDIFLINASNQMTSADSDGPLRCDVRKNTSDTPLSISGLATAMVGITTTGGFRFSAALTSGNGFAVGDNVNVNCFAKVGGITQPVAKAAWRLVAAETSGLRAVNVVAMTAGVLAEAVFGTDAISARVIATDAIGSQEIAASAIGVSEAPNLDAAISTRLAPTVAARTLDVTATGAAGIDWGNIENATTAVNFTATTIGGVVMVQALSKAAIAQFFTTDSGTAYGGAVAGSVVKEIADNSGGAGFTVAQIVASTWTYAIASCSGVAGSTCEKLNSAGSATDPLTNMVGSYSAGSLGHILGQLPDIAAGGAGGVFIAGSNAATTVNITGSITGSLSGSVGSVTGNVGGNVNGSTANVLAIAAGAINATSAPNLDAAISTRATYSVKKGSSFSWPMSFVSSTNHITPVEGVGVSCNRSIDAVNAFGVTTNSPTTTTSGTFGGLSTIVLSATDTNGDSYMYLWCTATGADDVKEKFRIEAP